MTSDADAAARERLAGEARATAASVLDWLGSRVDGQAAAPDARPPQSAGPCTWCPVCALVAALRGEAPELTARTAEQVSGLLVLLRLVLAEHGGHQHTAPPAPFAPEPAADPPEHPLHATFDPTPPAPWPAPWPAPRAAPGASDASSLAFTASESASSPAGPTAPAERPSGRRAPRPSPRRSTEPSAPSASAAPATAFGPGPGDSVGLASSLGFPQPGPEASAGPAGSGFGAPEPGLADPVGTRRRGVGDRDPATAAPPSSSPSRNQRRVVQRIPVRRVAPPGSC